MIHSNRILATVPRKVTAVLCATAVAATPFCISFLRSDVSFADGGEEVVSDACSYSLEVASGIPGFDDAIAFLNGNDVPLDRLKAIDLAALGSLYPELASSIAERIAQMEGVAPEEPSDPAPKPPSESGEEDDLDEGGVPPAESAPDAPEASGQGGADDALHLPQAPGSSEDVPFSAAAGDVVDPDATDPFAPNSDYPEWSYEGDATYITHHYTDDWDTERFVAVLGEQARCVAQEGDVYASLLIADAILSTASGLSADYLATNDLFGTVDYDEGDAATTAAIAVYRSQASVHPLAGIMGGDPSALHGTATPEKAAVASSDLVATVFSQEGERQRFGTPWKSLEDQVRRLRILAQVPGSQVRQAQTASWEEALAYMVSAGVMSEERASSIAEVVEDYDLTRFDEPLSYQLSTPILYPVTDPATGEVVEAEVKLADLVSEATSHLGVPYLWGGSSPEGFDCSGLVQYTYRHATGMSLPRTSYYQCLEGEDVDFSDLHIGDLLFFTKDGVCGHVAMYLADGYYVEAPQPGATVKVTSMDEHRPAFAKRLLPTQEVPPTPPEQPVILPPVS